MAWAKLGTKTLSSPAENVVFDSAIITPKKFNQIISHYIGTNNANYDLQLGYSSIDTGSNYAYRQSINGGTDSTITSHVDIRLQDAATVGGDNCFSVIYLINISSEEKLAITFSLGTGDASGSGTAPVRQEVVGKWVNTSNQQDLAKVRTSFYDLTVGSNITQIGTD
jgi:hypothetical protein